MNAPVVPTQASEASHTVPGIKLFSVQLQFSLPIVIQEWWAI